MKKIFNYNKFNNETQDTLVESFVALANAAMEGKNNTQEYKDANRQFNEDFMKECISAMPNTEFSGVDMLKNPMVNGDMFFLHRFNTLLAQMITPVVPTVVAAGYENLYDVTQVGWGDNAKYEVESNEMFIVNDAAVGIARGGVLTHFNTEYTIQAHKKEVGCYVDWYHVAAGKLDWGRFGVKVGLAYQAYIEGKVVKAMESAIDTTGSPSNAAKNGIAGYVANGFSDANWLATARNVQLANGGSEVYALGTKISLGDILPSQANATSAFRYTEDSAIVKTGYLPSYKGVPLVELGNALVPNTINGTPQTIVSDKIIYMVPMGMYKPVKVVFEGNTLTVEKNPLEMADHTYCLTVNMMVGVDVVVGSKFGAIVLP